MQYTADHIYVIKKGGKRLYWRWDDWGYTDDLTQAKRFSEEEAQEIVNKPNTDKSMHKFLEECLNN